MKPLLGSIFVAEFVDENYNTHVLFSVECRIKSSHYSSLQLPIIIKFCRRSCPQSKTIYLVLAYLLVLYEVPKATVSLLCRKHCHWWYVFLWWNLIEIADHASHNVPSGSLSLKQQSNLYSFHSYYMLSNLPWWFKLHANFGLLSLSSKIIELLPSSVCSTTAVLVWEERLQFWYVIEFTM